MTVQKSFNDFRDDFLSWSESHIESVRPNGFPICPYARKARLGNEIQFIDARENINACVDDLDLKKYMIAICWLGDEMAYTQKYIDAKIKQFSDDPKHTNLLFFISNKESGAFVKNFTNCIFVQIKSDIMSRRAYLKHTNYYDNWPAEYYKYITGEDK
jgi:hypothetical protein